MSATAASLAKLLAWRPGGYFRDALIVPAAQRAAAEVLFTQDMQAGQSIDNILIQNPFGDPA